MSIPIEKQQRKLQLSAVDGKNCKAECKKSTITGFAKQSTIDPDLGKQDINVGGKLNDDALKKTGQALTKVYNAISAEMIIYWQKMKPKERALITIEGFTKKHNLKLDFFKRHVRADGRLNDLGKAKIDEAEGKKYQPITPEIISIWQQLSQLERTKIKLAGFAKKNDINLNQLRTMVNKNGEIKLGGKKLIGQAAGKVFKPITAALIIKWINMSQAIREKHTIEGFAEQHSINLILFKRFATADGELKTPGKAKIDNAAGKEYQSITPELVNCWQLMLPEERKKITMDGFANKHNINSKRFSHLVRSDGTLQPDGMIMMDRTAGKKYQPLTAELITRWQKMDSQQRSQITMDEYAKQNNINPRQCYGAVNKNGVCYSAGKVILGKAGGAVYSPITQEHIINWRQMSQGQRDHITIEGFAERNNLHPLIWGKKVKVDGGLKNAGKSMMRKAMGQYYQPITDKLIIRWERMTQEARDQLTMGVFAEQNNVDPQQWIKSVTHDGRRRGAGQAKFDQAAKKVYQPINDKHITRWQSMAQEQRSELTLAGFAAQHGLNPLIWERTVKLNGGLFDAGKVIIEKASGKVYGIINADHITRWRDLLPLQRTIKTRREFAYHNNLNPDKWRKTVKLNGKPKINGELILAKKAGKKYNPAIGKHVSIWRGMTQTQRDHITLTGYARAHELDPVRWFFQVRADGGSRRKALCQQGQSSGEKRRPANPDSGNGAKRASMASLPDLIIVADGGPTLSSEHHVNNNSPILCDPGDLNTSILVREEGDISQIKVTHWAGLRDIFVLIPEVKRRLAVKREITDEMKNWLYAEGRHAERFNEMMEARLPDDGPPRGTTVFAKREIRQFEVLGAYSGVLHKTDDSLHKEMREKGSRPVLVYLWETRAQGRSVSGFQQSNILSLINTSHLSDNSPVWKHNNVGTVHLGKNLIFYVALENISAGEELLINYGHTYNPIGMKIKQEHG